jgi:hypothetical protein
MPGVTSAPGVKSGMTPGVKGTRPGMSETDDELPREVSVAAVPVIAPADADVSAADGDVAEADTPVAGFSPADAVSVADSGEVIDPALALCPADEDAVGTLFPADS